MVREIHLGLDDNDEPASTLKRHKAKGTRQKATPMKKLLLGFGALLMTVTAHEARPIAQAVRPSVVAIRGGTVLTVTRGTIQNGVVVLRDGKIAAVGGSNTAIPAGADVVDASGRFVTPGIIDAHSHIAADSINEGGTTVSSMTGIEDVLDPTDINIYRDLAGGLTVANVLHGSANPIGGKNQVIKLRWGKPARGLMFEGAMPGIKFALGENPKDMRQFGQTGPRRYPITRAGVEFVIRDAFSRAKAYQREWQEYDRRKKAGEDAVAPRRDLQLDPLVEILEGKRLVHAHSYRADEILMLLRVADEMGFKVATLQHVLEGYKVANEIAAHGAGASTFSDWWAYKVEAEDAIPYNVAIMHKRGVLVTVNSDSAEHSRRLNTEAAKSMHWGGLSEDEALALVTINPAKQLRIDTRVGSLEAGKDADVVIWNKHPLSTYAIVDRVYIDGQQYYDRLGEERRLTDARTEKGTLAAAEGRTGTTAPQASPQPRTSSDQDGFQLSAFSSRQERPTTDDRVPSTEVPGLGFSEVQPATGPVTAITNAKIYPISAAVIERGTIVIRGNRIEAVGANVAVPPSAQVIDAKGGEVYPGFIDARTTLGLNEPGPRGFDDANEMLEINAAVKAQVAYQADSDAIPVARVNGITTAAVIPAGGLLGGQIAVMNLDGWTWEEATLRPVAGVSFQFPTIGRTGGGGGGGGNPDANRKFEDLKKERDARVQRVEDLLERARAYSRLAANDRRTDWTLAALVPVVESRQPLFVFANGEREIRDAIAFADRAGVRIVITGGLESPLVAPLLKDKNIPVILGSVLTLPAREDAHHAATYRAAGELAQAGVTFAFGTGGASNNRLLPYEAAISVAWGLDRDRALRALTLDAATILGVGDRIGSLEPGKVANLFISTGDPMEMKTQFTHIFINGRSVGLRSKHTDLYERFSSRPGGVK
jgi:imidazolonepropionase-like amidohydrolase